MAGAARSSEEDDARISAKIKRKLDTKDRVIVRAMLKRGDRIQDVAYWFGVSPSTVHKIKIGRAQAAPTLTPEMPPPGPYALVAHSELELQKAVLSELEALVQRYRDKKVLHIRPCSQADGNLT